MWFRMPRTCVTNAYFTVFNLNSERRLCWMSAIARQFKWISILARQSFNISLRSHHRNENSPRLWNYSDELTENLVFSDWIHIRHSVRFREERLRPKFHYDSQCYSIHALKNRNAFKWKTVLFSRSCGWTRLVYLVISLLVDTSHQHYVRKQFQIYMRIQRMRMRRIYRSTQLKELSFANKCRNGEILSIGIGSLILAAAANRIDWILLKALCTRIALMWWNGDLHRSIQPRLFRLITLLLHHKQRWRLSMTMTIRNKKLDGHPRFSVGNRNLFNWSFRSISNLHSDSHFSWNNRIIISIYFSYSFQLFSVRHRNWKNPQKGNGKS